MKRILFVVALIVGSTFVTAGASAQSQVKATVPFEFNVNGSVVPAGTYMISANNIGTGCVEHFVVGEESSSSGDRRLELGRSGKR